MNYGRWVVELMRCVMNYGVGGVSNVWEGGV